jgi:hypothetical protein
MGVLQGVLALMLWSKSCEDRMRRIAVCLIMACLATPLRTHDVAAQQPNGSGSIPHAWLFGSWTGGLFPVPSGLTAQMCLAQPVVIFTRDIVLRATLVDQVYHQRGIETVRAEPGATDFRFAPTIEPGSAGLFGNSPPQPALGFGCPDPNSLHVVKRSDNEIVFEGCADFPEPLIRCPAR